jgi:hypothetical protein
MKSTVIEAFNRQAAGELNLLASMFGLEVSTDGSSKVSLTGEYAVVQVGIFPSHRTSITSTLRRTESDRVFGLNLILQWQNREVPLGSENLKTVEEMLLSLRQHAKAIELYCDTLIRGDDEEWRRLATFADQKYKENFG